MAGAVCIVTGGASGIGQASARRFAAEGAAAVIVVDQQPVPANEAAHLAASFQADVADADAPAEILRDVSERFGQPTVLLTAAGISVGRSTVDTDPQDWDRVFAVNVRGTFVWMQALLPGMIANGRGSIITVASQLAVNGGRGNAAYIASKGAVIALTRTAASEVAASGVRVNSLLPGATHTPLLDRSFARLGDPATARDRSLSRHPMGRFAEADEVAAAALYLGSEESSFTTGTELRVDGGWISG